MKQVSGPRPCWDLDNRSVPHAAFAPRAEIRSKQACRFRLFPRYVDWVRILSHVLKLYCTMNNALPLPSLTIFTINHARAYSIHHLVVPMYSARRTPQSSCRKVHNPCVYDCQIRWGGSTSVSLGLVLLSGMLPPRGGHRKKTWHV